MPVLALFTGLLLLGALYFLTMAPVLLLGLGVFWVLQLLGVQSEHQPVFAMGIMLLPGLGILLVVGLHCLLPCYFALVSRFGAALINGQTFRPREAVQIVGFYWENMLHQIGVAPPPDKSGLPVQRPPAPKVAP